MRPALVFAALAFAGCATAQFELPMTSDELVRYGTGPALVAYLSQPDATATVCDTRSLGPHLFLSPVGRDALVGGLVEGKIAPALWRQCVEKVLARSTPDQAADLLDALARAYQELINEPKVETDPRVAERLATLQRLYLERKTAANGHAVLIDPMFKALRQALDQSKLGPVATRLGRELLASVDVRAGPLAGPPGG